MKSISRSTWIDVGLPLFFLYFLIWINSGTLAPYALTSQLVLIDRCSNVLNQDHAHFIAPMNMLSGSPRAFWEFSVVLRRILLPLMAWPLMGWLGASISAFIAVFISIGVSFIYFLNWVKAHFGVQSRRYVAWLLATFPGYVYWAGLPYAYNLIIPSVLLGMVWLDRLKELYQKKSESRIEAKHLDISALKYGFLIGILLIGYDLFPYFVIAMLYLAYRQSYRRLILSGVGLILPTLIWLFILKNVYGAPLLNDNTGVYSVILKSYLPPYDLLNWGKLTLQFPVILFLNIFDSNFILLPFLTLVAVGVATVSKIKVIVHKNFIGFGLAGLLLFTINNIGPPYTGWQMRGVWIARIYIPSFICWLGIWLGLFRSLGSFNQKVSFKIKNIFILLCVLNALVSIGNVFAWEISGRTWYRFYGHGTIEGWLAAHAVHGVKPYGICKPTEPIIVPIPADLRR